MLYFDFFLTEFNPLVYQNYILYWKLTNLITWVGYLTIIIVLERFILKGKSYYLISIFYLISIIISLVVSDFELVQIVAAIPTALGVLFIPFSYLYLAKYSHIRKKALIIFFGYMVFFFGYLLLAQFIVNLFISISDMEQLTLVYLIYITSMIFRIGGIALLSYGYLFYEVSETK